MPPAIDAVGLILRRVWTSRPHLTSLSALSLISRSLRQHQRSPTPRCLCISSQPATEAQMIHVHALHPVLTLERHPDDFQGLRYRPSRVMSTVPLSNYVYSRLPARLHDNLSEQPPPASTPCSARILACSMEYHTSPLNLETDSLRAGLDPISNKSNP